MLAPCQITGPAIADGGARTYAFCHCQLDLGRRELRSNGQIVSLRPKVFDLLTALIENSDRVVGKDELLDRIWPNRYISETTLASCLKELRKALGDTGKEKKIIKTLHGKGFRFVADLEPESCLELAAHAPVSSFASEGDPSPPPPPPPPAARIGNTVTDVAAGTCERKDISVLRCGLVNDAEPTERLEAEAMHELLRELHTEAQRVVCCLDGQVTQWLSDGFVAMFGGSVAYEDHARRALLAATELANRSRPEASNAAAVSFGIGSGPAIISQVPDNPQQCYPAYCDILQEAERLQQQASAGRVLISADSYDLLRADVRVRQVPGCADGVLVDRVVAQRAGVPRRFKRHLAPLIGRDLEMSFLRQRLACAEQGHGQAVVLTGSPGIGKSRLLAELRQNPGGSDVRFIQANCYPRSNGSAHFPLADYLRECCGISDHSSPATAQEKLRSQLQAAELTGPDALPLLLKLLGLPYDDSAIRVIGAQAQLDRSHFYLQCLLLNTAQTTVIAVEDMHWMEATARSWLEGLIAQLANKSVLFVATTRVGFSADWLQLPWVSQYSLSRLAQDNCLRLLEALPRADTLGDRIPELATQSGGNPFFLEELALNALSNGKRIPSTVHGVLAARIDQLRRADKQLLQIAAIVGLRGSLQLLSSICGLDSEQTERSLARLQSAELLFSDFVDGDRIFVFRHALVQEVAYGNQLAAQRRSMHATIAGQLVLDSGTAGERQPEQLAYHYSEAGCHEDAVRCWQRAGRKARERSAYIEAIDCANQGLAVLERIEDPMARSVHELALQRTLGPALMSVRGYGAREVEQTWVRARTLCQQLDDESSLFRVLVGLGHYYWVSGQLAKAYICNRQLVRLAQRAGNASFLLRASAAMGSLMLHRGRVRSAERYLDQCMKLIDNGPRTSLATQNAAVSATCYSAFLRLHQGRERQALDYAERALQRAREQRHPFTIAVALCLTAELHRFRGDYRNAQALAREGVDISYQQGYPFWYGSTLVTLGWAEARGGDSAKGIATIGRGLDAVKSTGASVQMASWLGALADAQRISGDVDGALKSVDQGIACAERIGDRHCLARLGKLRTLLARAKRKPTSANDCREALTDVA